MYRLDKSGVFDTSMAEWADKTYGEGDGTLVKEAIEGSSPLLVEFLHDGKTGRRRGVVVASGPGMVGFSLANEKKGDKFNQEFGLMKAAMRSKRRNQTMMDGHILPFEYRSTYVDMIDRSYRYFKG